METIGTASGGHPNLNLTPEERRVYTQLLKEADPDGFGAVSGDVAVKFFERTKLPADVLGQIWQIADAENRGLLTPAGFGVVLRLIGHAQAGRAPSIQLAPSRKRSVHVSLRRILTDEQLLLCLDLKAAPLN